MIQTVYEDHWIKVEENGSGEIFVTVINFPKSCIRVSPTHDGEIRVTCHDGTLIPSSHNGLQEFIALPGKVVR